MNDGKWAIKRTHTLALLQLNVQKYIADSRFGNLSRLPLYQIDGKEVTSPAGVFRLRTHQTEKGNIALEILNDQGVWDIRYAFHWEEIAWGRLSVMK